MRAPKLLMHTKTLALDANGTLRVVIVADTHSAPHPGTAKLITALAPHHILHAGDIGDLAVVSQLAELAPTSVVRGNIDAHGEDLPDVITIAVHESGLVNHEARAPEGRAESSEEALFKLLLLHIGVNGPRIRADAARLARAQGARLVICGHSHVPFLGRDRDLSVFNPGSIGPRRFPLPIVFGVMDVTRTDGLRVEFRHIDCETGQRWLP